MLTLFRLAPSGTRKLAQLSHAIPLRHRETGDFGLTVGKYTKPNGYALLIAVSLIKTGTLTYNVMAHDAFSKVPVVCHRLRMPASIAGPFSLVADTAAVLGSAVFCTLSVIDTSKAGSAGPAPPCGQGRTA
ncbi:hypothetical protein MAFF211479_20170 [Ralstonia solanacearum]|nr:hypothetical protein MAFF211479_20170 [Ralstonia solanacearum]BCN04882.1 hypothetical protein RPSB_20190 [Ralstonia solanacearum]